jgi:hypothetical protein
MSEMCRSRPRCNPAANPITTSRPRQASARTAVADLGLKPISATAGSARWARVAGGSIAHIPALRALPDCEIGAVCTTRQDSADQQEGLRGAFSVFRHREARAAPGCRFSHGQREGTRPLPAGHGRNRSRAARLLRMAAGPQHDEATRMLAASRAQRIGHAIGSKARCLRRSTTKDLIAEGYVGRVLSATMIGCAPNWGATIDPRLPGRFR